MVMIDAFGTIALVAMTPTISIQVVGLMYKLKLRRSESAEAAEADEVVIDMPEATAIPVTSAEVEEIEIIEFSLDSLSITVRS